MHRVSAILTASVVGLAAPAIALSQARGQQAELGVLAGRVADEQGRTHTGLTLAPSLTWSEDGSVVRVSGHGSLFEGGVFGSAAMGVGLRAARLGPLRLILGGEGVVAGSDAGYRAARGSVAPRLRVSHGPWGIEAAPQWAGGGERTVRQAPAGLPPLGGSRTESDVRWRTQRGVGVGGWFAPGPVTLQAGWRTMEAGATAWDEWSGAATLDLGAASLSVTAGRRTGALQEEWAGGSASLSLGGGAALVAEAGAFPSDPLMGRAGGRYASVGVRMRLGNGGRPGGALPGPRPIADGDLRLSLSAEPGSRVELLGDWTEWQPLPVPEVRPGRYEVAVSLPQGTHRFAFRVNGEWRVPEGVETEPDPYGGERAVIRVGEG